MKKSVLFLSIVLVFFLGSCVTSKNAYQERQPFAPTSISKQQELNRRNNTPNFSKLRAPSKRHYKRAARKVQKNQDGAFVHQIIVDRKRRR